MPSTKRKRTVAPKTTNKKEKLIMEAKISNPRNEDVSRVYGITFPENVFKFWEMCKKLNPNAPLGMIYVILYAMICRIYSLLGSFRLKSGQESAYRKTRDNTA